MVEDSVVEYLAGLSNTRHAKKIVKHIKQRRSLKQAKLNGYPFLPTPATQGLGGDFPAVGTCRSLITGLVHPLLLAGFMAWLAGTEAKRWLSSQAQRRPVAVASTRRRRDAPGILEQEDELPVVAWCGLETEAPIEGIGLGVDRMRQQRSNAGVLGHGDRSSDGVLQEAEAETAPLVAPVDCQPRQDDQRDRVLPHPAADPLRRFERVDLADGEAEVPGHAIVVTGDEGARRPAPLGLASVSQQPVRERRFAAVEPVDSVMNSKRLRRRQAHLSAQTGRRENRSANPGLSDSGRSSISRIAWY